MISLRTRAAVSAALTVLFAVTSTVAVACRCAGLTTSAAYQQADLVVLGAATQVDGDPFGRGGASVRFEVDQAWKHSATSTIKIVTATSCAIDFKAGEQFLLFLRYDTGNSHYVARACQGSELAANSAHQQEWLNVHATAARIEKAEQAE